MARIATALLILFALVTTSEAALIGRSTFTTGLLRYEGFGDVGGGVGSGRYTLGNCAFASGTTTCTLSGSYVETAESDHTPGLGGTFTLRLVYPGNGPSPVTARSRTSGSDGLQFSSIGTAVYILDLSPSAGGAIAGVFPEAVFADSIAFATFLDPGTVGCTGLSAAQPCRVGQVGLVPGAILTGAVNPFEFTIPGKSGTGGATVDVIEFYNASLDHYFITWLPAEIANLDAGRTPTRWVQTGHSFRIYTSAQTGTSPVCRFYIPPAKGDSHFFGRGTAECNATGQSHPDFVLEEANFMFVFLPTAGVCPNGTRPVYRAFSNRSDANHRYMVEPAVRSQMVARGWLPEGDGPDLVVMCAPL